MPLGELLRPPPHRGPLIAAGAVALAVGVALEELRLGGTVAAGVHALVLLATGALCLWLGAQAPNEDGRPPAYQSVLLVTGLLSVYPGLLRLGEALDAPGTSTWASTLVAAAAAWAAFARRSAVCLLLAAIAGGVAVLALWHWVTHAHSQAPYRWLLFLMAGACGVGSLALRARAPRHAEQLVNAGGLAIAAIGATGVLGGFLSLVLTPFGSGVFGASLLPGWWELVLLAAGFGLIAFGAVERTPGAAYLGVTELALFVAAVGRSPEPTLYWWPVVLVVVGAGALAAGLRPRRPLPPQPAPYRAGDQPLAARADAADGPVAAERSDGGDVVVRIRDDSPPNR